MMWGSVRRILPPTATLLRVQNMVSSSSTTGAGRIGAITKNMMQRSSSTASTKPSDEERIENAVERTMSFVTKPFDKEEYDMELLSPEDRPFLHFHRRRRTGGSGRGGEPRKKFKRPEKRASKLFNELNTELVAQFRAAKPEVHDVDFRPGDAIEITQVATGGVNSTDLEKIRGVVLGIHKRGLGTGVYIRDVLQGEPVEWKISLFSPLVKKVEILERNFVKKGKRIKRAKLYYLRDRPDNECQVTKGK